MYIVEPDVVQVPPTLVYSRPDGLYQVTLAAPQAAPSAPPVTTPPQSVPPEATATPVTSRAAPDRHAGADAHGRAARPQPENSPMAGGGDLNGRDLNGSLNEMVVESVRVHMMSSQHVVILRDTVRDRYLPIWIGPWEANAIAMRLQGVTPERPMTHDLFSQTLDELGVVGQADHRRRTWPRTRSARGCGSRWTAARWSSTPGRATRSPWPSAPACPSSRPTAVLDRAGVIPESARGEKPVRLPRVRELANVDLPDEPGQPPGRAREEPQRLRPAG